MAAASYLEQPRIAYAYYLVLLQMSRSVVYLVLRPSGRNALEGQDFAYLESDHSAQNYSQTLG